MNYKIVTTEDFDRKVKSLAKKYRSLFEDLKIFKKDLLENPTLGDKLDDNTRKVRMAIASKHKGKRSGAKVITYHFFVDTANTKIYLLAIYDKGEQQSISKKEIRYLKEKNGLISNL
jgi:mRNA-degrading endonuclease RelE of RelBE toxin-antitoxin system